VSWAIGATIAVIVGLVLATVRHLRERVLATELQALQARINPHFLFNTLNSIAALIREDPQRAEAMTLQLSALFRYTLQAPRAGLVTLEEELTIVEGYLSIEQERLGNRLSYSVDVDPELLALRVPPLFLQPLVENAIKHGVAPNVRGGAVTVRGWLENGRLNLTVENTGSGEPQTGGTGEGIKNVRERLRGTFGATATLTLRRSDAGTQAHISFSPKPS
jgi:LytS/YehU family sensor histidine kinase